MAAVPKNLRRSVLQADRTSHSQMTRCPEATYLPRMESRVHRNAHCTKVYRALVDRFQRSGAKKACSPTHHRIMADARPIWFYTPKMAYLLRHQFPSPF